jgi:hypothetical protein
MIGTAAEKPGQHLIYISGEFSRLAWLGLSPAISTRRLSYVSDLICHCMALLLVKLRFAGSSRLNSPPMLRRSWPGLKGNSLRVKKGHRAYCRWPHVPSRRANPG